MFYHPVLSPYGITLTSHYLRLYECDCPSHKKSPKNGTFLISKLNKLTLGEFRENFRSQNVLWNKDYFRFATLLLLNCYFSRPTILTVFQLFEKTLFTYHCTSGYGKFINSVILVTKKSWIDSFEISVKIYRFANLNCFHFCEML